MDHPFGIQYENISYLLNPINSRISNVKSLLCERDRCRGKSRTEDSRSSASGLARLVPTQQRSRERFEKILSMRGRADG
jgi:hypothetical protein